MSDHEDPGGLVPAPFDPSRASRLAAFLDHPRRPPETLSYHGLQGFLFAIATGPVLVDPNEWFPAIFAGKRVGFESREETSRVVPDFIWLYDLVDVSVTGEPPRLLPDCQFRDDLLANLDDDAPVSRWSRGFLRGYRWLQKEWEPFIPADYDRDFAALIMTLSFFASRTVADAYVKMLRAESLEEAASLFRESFPDALAGYAIIGLAIRVLLEERGITGLPSDYVAGKRPCPCGSGRDYKDCCGAAPVH